MSETASTAAALRILFPPATRAKLLLSFVGSVAVSFVETASLLLLLPLLDLLGGGTGTAVTATLSKLLGNPPRQTLVLILVGAVLGGFILKDIFTLWYRWWAIGFTNRLQVETSTRMLDYFLHAPYAMHLQRTLGDLMRSMGESVSQFYSRTVAGVLGIVTESLTILTMMGALIFIMPVQALLLIAYFGLAGLAYLKFVKPRVDEAGTRQLDASRASFEAAVHSFGGIKEIQIRHSQPHFTDRYRQAALTNAEAARTSSFLGEAPKYLLEVLFILGLGVLVLTTQDSNATAGAVGTLALLAAAAFRILPSMTRLISNITSVRAGEPARKLLFAELAEEQRLAPRNERLTDDTILPLHKEIRFEDVSFTYGDATEPVLKGVSFVIPAGSSLALVGGSGAGKTTLADLLLGLHKPTSGRILVDGVDIATHMAPWQNNIAFVPQDVFHMDLPFSLNITFDQYLEEVDQERLHNALKQAQLLDLVEMLPKGLETTIGDRGIRLSGGQRQRIGIARALYRNPRLLVLDEATSALDNDTERKITETINRLHGSLTIVVIAHRLSTVRDVDTIVLLREGRVAGTGTFAELTSSNEEFAHLVALGTLEDGPPADSKIDPEDSADAEATPPPAAH